MKGDGSFNNKTKFQDAMEEVADMATGQGGTLYMDSGAYVLGTGLLDYQRGVNIVGHPYGTVLLIDHATNDFFRFVTTGLSNTAGPSCRFENITFGSKQANSGTVLLTTSSPYNMRFINCAFNDPFNSVSGYDNLNGNFWRAASLSKFSFERCKLWQKGTAVNQELFRMSGDGRLRVHNSYIHQAPTTDSTLMLASGSGGKTWITNNEFDSFDALNADLLLYANTGQNILTGNTFKSDLSSGRAVMWNSGIQLIEYDNLFENINMYNPAGALLAGGSRLSLGRPLVLNTSSNSIVVPGGYRAYSVKSTGTAPTVSLPLVLFPGQEFFLTIWNNSGSTWSGISFGSSAVGGLTGSTPTGTARTYHFRGLSINADSSYIWVCVGDFSGAFTP